MKKLLAIIFTVIGICYAKAPGSYGRSVYVDPTLTGEKGYFLKVVLYKNSFLLQAKNCDIDNKGQFRVEFSHVKKRVTHINFYIFKKNNAKYIQKWTVLPDRAINNPHAQSKPFLLNYNIKYKKDNYGNKIIIWGTIKHK